MAEALTLEHRDEVTDSADGLESLDEFLRSDNWLTPKTNPVTPDKVDPPGAFQSLNASEVRRYLNLATIALGYKQTFVGSLQDHPALLGSLPVDFKGAKPERTLSAKIDADLAVWESRSHAGRILGTLDVSQRREFKDPLPDDVTTPTDSFSIGGRIEGRKITPKWALELRPYGGLFLEGAFHSTTTALTATRDAGTGRNGFTLAETAGFETPITFQPSHFAYGSGGLDVLPAAKDLLPSANVSASITKLGLDLGYGQITHVPTSISLGDVPQDLTRFIGEGAKKLLNEYFVSHLDTFNDTVQWKVDDDVRWQFRVRFRAEGEVAWIHWNRTFKATLTLRQDNITMRGDVPATALAWNTKFTSTFAVPLVWRLELAPTYEFQLAGLQGGDKQHFGIQKLEIKANLPLFVRFGKGAFLQ
jgi:hypothetical protein